MIVEVEPRPVCNTLRFYPISSDAKALCKIIGKKTLNEMHLAICLGAGWIVTYKKQGTK